MRPTCQRSLVPVAVLAFLTGVTPQIGVGQGRALALVGGAWEYDLSGTGTSGFGGLRLELPVDRFLVIEPGLAYANYSTQFEQGVNYLLPEIQAQIQVPGRWVRPFLAIDPFHGTVAEWTLGIARRF